VRTRDRQVKKATNLVASQADNEPPLIEPHGLDEIIATLGDIYA
jgi:hypothetical protein